MSTDDTSLAHARLVVWAGLHATHIAPAGRPHFSAPTSVSCRPFPVVERSPGQSPFRPDLLAGLRGRLVPGCRGLQYRRGRRSIFGLGSGSSVLHSLEPALAGGLAGLGRRLLALRNRGLLVEMVWGNFLLCSSRKSHTYLGHKQEGSFCRKYTPGKPHFDLLLKTQAGALRCRQASSKMES